jgi:hypothetical protein
MRRGEFEVRERAEVEGILRRAQVVRLAMVDGGRPYVVPMAFGYEDGRLYVHSAREGRKIDVIRRSPRVCFEVEADVKLIVGEEACGWTFEYACVIGTGTATIVEGQEEKRRGLDVIMRQYSEKSFEYPEKAVERIVVIRVDVEEMRGKRRGR